jgi:hypothetical protein
MFCKMVITVKPDVTIIDPELLNYESANNQFVLRS